MPLKPLPCMMVDLFIQQVSRLRSRPSSQGQLSSQVKIALAHLLNVIMTPHAINDRAPWGKGTDSRLVVPLTRQNPHGLCTHGVTQRRVRHQYVCKGSRIGKSWLTDRFPKAPKRARCIAIPARAMTQDAPLDAYSANLALTPSPLPSLDFSDDQGTSRVEGTQTHSSKPPTATQHDRVIPGQGRTFITRSLSAPYPDLGQNPPFGGACRPSVIVYRVTRGPNLAKSKDVVRISYGEGFQKRTPKKCSGRRIKVCGRGSSASLKKVLRIIKRGDATVHMDMKSVRSYFYTTQRRHGLKQLLSTCP